MENREELYDWIVDQGYECWQHFPKLYNEDNYHGGVSPNVFGDCISANLICVHRDSDVKKSHFHGFELLNGDVKITIIN
jgi:hypothetical protein